VGTTSKCHFSPILPSGSPKIGTLVVPKLWTFISFSNQIFFKNSKIISYSPQKDLSKGLKHALIGPHLTPTFKGFVVKNQIPNLTLAPSFDHNSRKSSLNEQWEGTWSIYALGIFQWCPRGPIWCLFSFLTKALNICNPTWVQFPKWECTWESLGFIPCTLPHFWECVSHLNTLLSSWALALHTQSWTQC